MGKFELLPYVCLSALSAEAKLKRLQGKSERRPKDMLKSLSDTREHQMRGFLGNRDPFSVAEFQDDEDDVRSLSPSFNDIFPILVFAPRLHKERRTR